MYIKNSTYLKIADVKIISTNNTIAVFLPKNFYEDIY